MSGGPGPILRPVMHENGASRDAESKLYELSAGQYGVFTRAEAAELGLGRRVVAGRTEAGRWEILLPGVYRPAGTPETPRQRLMAAVLWAGEGAVASHRAAASLHRLPAGRRDAVEVSVPPGRHPRHAGVVVHRPKQLPPLDVTVVDGIPVTTVDRTLIDLGGVLSKDELEENIDFAYSHGHVRRVRMEFRAEELGGRGRRGTPSVRDLVVARSGGQKLPDSILETRLGRILGPLKPVYGYVVIVGKQPYVLDCALLDVMIDVEGDGWEAHHGRQNREVDMTRQNALVSVGWTPLRYAWSHIVSDPEGIMAEVLATRARIIAARR